ncbi:hypothetical protein GPECTOR_21g655 [Gonium pectorale]|uniref:Uncharacterized protein n=1 Tax=Gonium pectorale TaxID=33097 RepID=A0A150GHZ8_GONPE|nr:hypothetical protein GPECTOR_21g655 [Gonium pectorale]|eukprot:KXZ49429.1 hypothetical protein GPECTOR_21g655 [Gonium pectorale]
MYVYDESFDKPDILERVRDFVISGFANSNPLDVPEYYERTLNIPAFEAAATKPNKNMMVLGAGLIIAGPAF